MSMKIEHIGLFVQDLEKMRQFYEKYFGGVSGAKYHNPKTTFQSYFLTFSDGARLEICAKENLLIRERADFGYLHLAFSVESKEKVEQLTEELRADGFKILSEARTTGDGYYESVVLDPEGNQIEITI